MNLSDQRQLCQPRVQNKSINNPMNFQNLPSQSACLLPTVNDRHMYLLSHCKTSSGDSHVSHKVQGMICPEQISRMVRFLLEEPRQTGGMEHGVTTLDVFLQFKYYFTSATFFFSATQSAKERECCDIGFIAWERWLRSSLWLMSVRSHESSKVTFSNVFSFVWPSASSTIPNRIYVRYLCPSIYVRSTYNLRTSHRAFSFVGLVNQPRTIPNCTYELPTSFCYQSWTIPNRTYDLRTSPYKRATRLKLFATSSRIRG